MKTTIWILGIALVLVIVYAVYQYNNSQQKKACPPGTLPSQFGGCYFNHNLIPGGLARTSQPNFIVIRDTPTQNKQVPVDTYGCHDGIRYIWTLPINNNPGPGKWIKTNQPCQPGDKVF